MAQIFSEKANQIPRAVIAGVVVFIAAMTGFFWYFGSPEFTSVGYRPQQPVPFSHKLHAGDLGLDCRYCHFQVERSPFANIPATQVCMNCHKLILPESEKLLPVRESFATGKPLHWIRVHKLPDFAYFDHSLHLRAGVSCFECHGNVPQEEVVMQQEPLSMGWCLECHRDPEPHLRPSSEITNFDWTGGEDQVDLAAEIKRQKRLVPPTDCSGCHR